MVARQIIDKSSVCFLEINSCEAIPGKLWLLGLDCKQYFNKLSVLNKFLQISYKIKPVQKPVQSAPPLQQC